METHSYEPIVFDEGLPIKLKVHRLTAYRLRWYSNPQVIFLAKGSVNLHVNQKTYLLREQQIAFIGSGELYSLDCTNEPNLLVELQFDGSAFATIGLTSEQVFSRERFHQDQNTAQDNFFELRRLMANTVWHYNKRMKGYEYQVVSNVYAMLAWLLRYDYFQPGRRGDDEGNAQYSRISGILRYMSENYDQDLTLRSVAEHEHISYYYLSSSFTKATGMTFREHLSQIRLQKSMADLRGTRKSIELIAGEYGFSSARSYASLFTRQYGVTPSQYRDAYWKRNPYALDSRDPGPGDEADYNLIYAMMDEMQASAPPSGFWHEEHNIAASVAAGRDETPLNHVWSMTTTCARMSNLLRSDVQQIVRRARAEVGFRYMRCHSLFDDDMMIVSRDGQGQLRYNWLYLDQALDFLTEIGMRPFLELSFMPTALASGDKTVFLYGANITPPREMGEWRQLVRALMRHCVDRYGAEEVGKWYVEVWSQPDYRDFFWAGTQQDYFELYRASAEAVKAVCPDTKVGGPSVTSVESASSEWIRAFCQFCRDERTPLDFVSFHVYTESNAYMQRANEQFPSMPKSPRIVENSEQDMIRVQIEAARKAESPTEEFHVTEWNISPRHVFCIRDSCFMAPYIIHATLTGADKLRSMTYWSLCDILDEFRAPYTAFHGGMGLVTAQGIPKAGYLALCMLSQLGDSVVARGDNWILTRRGRSLQLLVYQLAYLDLLAQQATDFTSEYTGNVYALFEEKPTAHFNIMLEDCEDTYRMSRCELNQRHGSAYDTWLAMGAKQEISKNESDYLIASAKPRLTVQEITAQQCVLKLDAYVPANGCQLILLDPIA